MPAIEQIKYQTFFCDVKTDWTDKMTYWNRKIKLLTEQEVESYFKTTHFLGILTRNIEGSCRSLRTNECVKVKIFVFFLKKPFVKPKRFCIFAHAFSAWF